MGCSGNSRCCFDWHKYASIVEEDMGHLRRAAIDLLDRDGRYGERKDLEKMDGKELASLLKQTESHLFNG